MNLYEVIVYELAEGRLDYGQVKLAQVSSNYGGQKHVILEISLHYW